jgi:hypothetical protein
LDLPFKVEMWDRHGQHIRWVVSANTNVTIARAAFEAAVANYPDQRFTLRQGMMVIRTYPPEERERRT